MQKTILIGEKEFEFRASALTSMLYKDLFGEDLIRELPKIQENAAVDKIIGLAFVMNFQATSKNALEESKEKLTIDSPHLRPGLKNDSMVSVSG